MGFKSITLTNFKNIGSESQTIEFKPITLLFGPNSAGKSTVIHALHYAREIFERGNINPGHTITGGSSVDLGGFESFVHNHDKNLEIILRFDLDLADEDLPDYFYEYEDIGEPRSESEFKAMLLKVQTVWVEISVQWSALESTPILNRYSVGINEYKLATIEVSDDARQVYISSINPFNPVFLEDSTPEEARNVFASWLEGEKHTEDNFDKVGILIPMLAEVMEFGDEGIPGLTQHIGIANQKENALPSWGSILNLDHSIFNDEVELKDRRDFIEVLSSLIVGPGEMVLNTLKEFRYIGPLREVPPRHYTPELSPRDSGWSSGMAAWDILSRLDEDSTVLATVNDWLSDKEKLNSGYHIEVKKYKEVDVDGPLAVALKQGRHLDNLEWFNEALENLPSRTKLILRDVIKELEVMPQDVGIGISQVIPVVVAAVYLNSGIVVIEQPELHIHAAFQVALGDLFASMIRQEENLNENKDIIFLLETHSEYMTLRFLRRLYETSQDELEPGAPHLTPEDLTIYYVNPSEEGTEIKQLRVDEEGEFLDQWPRGFFAERTRELF